MRCSFPFSFILPYFFPSLSLLEEAGSTTLNRAQNWHITSIFLSRRYKASFQFLQPRVHPWLRGWSAKSENTSFSLCSPPQGAIFTYSKMKMLVSCSSEDASKLSLVKCQHTKHPISFSVYFVRWLPSYWNHIGRWFPNLFTWMTPKLTQIRPQTLIWLKILSQDFLREFEFLTFYFRRCMKPAIKTHILSFLQKLTTISGSYCKQTFQHQPAECEYTVVLTLVRTCIFTHALTYFLSRHLFVPPSFCLVGWVNSQGIERSSDSSPPPHLLSL